MSLIAIFSDVHGNLPALKTVLKDIESKNADQVYCLGDLVDFAPWTNEVIDLIKSSRIPCLMGNHDERIAFDKPIIPLSKHSEEETIARKTAINYTKIMISAANRAYLASLPRQLSLNYRFSNESVNILLVHASTRSNEEYIYENHDVTQVREMMNQYAADILVMGHTHESYIREVSFNTEEQKKLAVNCGSVGRSKEGYPHATYLLLAIDDQNIKAELIKLAYPVHETIEGIRQSGIPDFYADFLIP